LRLHVVDGELGERDAVLHQGRTTTAVPGPAPPSRLGNRRWLARIPEESSFKTRRVPCRDDP
ncbi:hypothetical protein AB0L28_25545, partial [Streptomyces sp. NPDC052503]|uniref:hypothetical protein n=1 Tax=Streptomyces sp. NPDC052503 TaxID=3156683 RepID=UPI003434BE68